MNALHRSSAMERNLWFRFNLPYEESVNHPESWPIYTKNQTL